MSKTDKFWSYDFSILLRADRIVEFFPTPDMTHEEKLNALTRFSLYFGIFLSMIRKTPNFLLICLIGMSVTYFINKNTEERVEYDKEKDMSEEKSKNLEPTLDNPFANPVITDYASGKDIKFGCDVNDPETKEKMNKFYSEGIYQDANDIYNNQNSQRQFYTLPENDQDKYAKWLYSKKDTCKENNSCIEQDIRRIPFDSSFPSISLSERQTAQSIALGTTVKTSY